MVPFIINVEVTCPKCSSAVKESKDSAESMCCGIDGTVVICKCRKCKTKLIVPFRQGETATRCRKMKFSDKKKLSVILW
ncbi:MAG: hypothetical protein UHN47_03555 [Lachnospiraceae bacterium]|nr:hypothetical protein [Lachnospiraceae bacterium]